MTVQITATIEPARQNSQQKVSCRWLNFLTAFHHDEVGMVASGTSQEQPSTGKETQGEYPGVV
jgi:hypothetical protein